MTKATGREAYPTQQNRPAASIRQETTPYMEGNETRVGGCVFSYLVASPRTSYCVKTKQPAINTSPTHHTSQATETERQAHSYRGEH